MDDCFVAHSRRSRAIQHFTSAMTAIEQQAVPHHEQRLRLLRAEAV